MKDCAIIFDVDGVLLDLTRDEEELFFQPFEKFGDTSQLSRDWNSYRIRNDEEILHDICDRLGVADRETIKSGYLDLLRSQLAQGQITSPAIPGAAAVLEFFAPRAMLGIATANFREAARLRLENAGLWHQVKACAFGADGGGPKHEILGRALAAHDLPKSRIVYVGDNLNDVEAGQRHGVAFIGFSTDQKRLMQLANAGVKNLGSDHIQTQAMIKTILRL